jgi:thioredoxin-related protein
MITRPSALLILFCAALGLAPARAAELVMFERAGCGWCERFNAEIGVVYDRTDEGAKARLRRVDLDKPRPADLAKIDPGAFTPTFVLVDDGQEIGRIRGYAGEMFFYGYLDNLLAKLDGKKTSTTLVTR